MTGYDPLRVPTIGLPDGKSHVCTGAGLPLCGALRGRRDEMQTTLDDGPTCWWCRAVLERATQLTGKQPIYRQEYPS